MTNAAGYDIPFEILNALNEFESFGLDSIHKTDSTDPEFTPENADLYINAIWVQFDQLRGDIYKYFDPETENKPRRIYRRILARVIRDELHARNVTYFDGSVYDNIRENLDELHARATAKIRGYTCDNRTHFLTDQHAVLSHVFDGEPLNFGIESTE